MSRPILLCTVGTSLFFPNLAGLRKTLAEDDNRPDGKKTIREELRPATEALTTAYEARDWAAVAVGLGELPPSERLCGAEVNSVTSLIRHCYAPADTGIYFFHSDTDDGRNIANVLCCYYRDRGHSPVEPIPVPDLQDQDAKRFRTKGLRNLVKLLCARVREHSAEACAINATGGYKAQIAVAVLLGQALGMPVYYMHERFSEIIPFPPLPVALDVEVWMRASGMLAVLERPSAVVPRSTFEEEWDERFESLVEPETIDGVEYLTMSAAGQIFHETFRERFRSGRDRVLPPPAEAARKRPPALQEHAVINLLRNELSRYLQAVTTDVPQVVQCITNYCNPNLPETNRFRETRGEVQGIYSDGTRTVKFTVETTATSPGQQAAVVAALNEWLTTRS